MHATPDVVKRNVVKWGLNSEISQEIRRSCGVVWPGVAT